MMQYMRTCRSCNAWALSDLDHEEKLFRNCPKCSTPMYLMSTLGKDPRTEYGLSERDYIDLPESYAAPE